MKEKNISKYKALKRRHYFDTRTGKTTSKAPSDLHKVGPATIHIINPARETHRSSVEYEGYEG